MRVTLVPSSGLCNRLNAIHSGLAYKEKNPNVELRILWWKYWHCSCRFRDLFKQLPTPYTPVNELILSFWNIPAHRFNFGLPQRLRHLWYDCSILPNTPADEFDNITNGKKNVYVYHPNRFCKESMSGSLGEIFRPVDELQKRIDNITHDWNGNVIGLHIRRTDNQASITQSPIDHFYDVIEKELAKNASIRFYLATDDESVKKELKSRYGDKIITIPLCLKRNSRKGMKDAVVDLYCLGMTNKIYGSAHSTYSTFAANLFNKPIII